MYFAKQDIYGCGPQSTPVLDPQTVLCFQRALLEPKASEVFGLTLAIHGSSGDPS